MRRNPALEVKLDSSRVSSRTPAPREDIPLVDKIVGYAVSLLLFGWLGVADLPLKFHPAAIRASAGFAPVDAVSCSA